MVSENLIKSLERMLQEEVKREDCNSKFENISILMDAVETLKNCIELRNIDLTGLTLLDEIEKAEEESKEFYEALVKYGYYRTDKNRKHLIEEGCDKMQVTLSELKSVGIDIPEVAKHWNTEHLSKIQLRPRRK